MNNSLKARFEAGIKVELDPQLQEIYVERIEIVLPKITRDIRNNQKRVAQLRQGPAAPVKRDAPVPSKK